MKFLKFAGLSILALLAVGCKNVNVPPGYEAVLVERPIIFGSGGIDPTPWRDVNKWAALSTEAVMVSMVPHRQKEPFDDLSTSNNNFIDYDSYLSLQVIDSVALIKNFGKDWYIHNLKEQYRTIVRDVVRKHTFADILSTPATTAKIEDEVRSELDAVIKRTKLPVRVVDMSLGRAMPNKEVVAEMNRTAAQQQRKKTLYEAEQAEIQRKQTEAKRADADKEYVNRMNMDANQFVQLQVAREYAAACRATGTTCYVFSDKTPVVAK